MFIRTPRSAVCMCVIVLITGLSTTVAALNTATEPQSARATSDQTVVYQTYGVHNPPDVSPCAYPTCIYKRAPGEPTDPQYPAYWTSHWDMYRIYTR